MTAFHHHHHPFFFFQVQSSCLLESRPGNWDSLDHCHWDSLHLDPFFYPGHPWSYWLRHGALWIQGWTAQNLYAQCHVKIHGGTESMKGINWGGEVFIYTLPSPRLIDISTMPSAVYSVISVTYSSAAWKVHVMGGFSFLNRTTVLCSLYSTIVDTTVVLHQTT